MKNKTKLKMKLRKGLLRALKAKGTDLARKLLPQTTVPARRKTSQDQPWEQFTPKYREGEPVPGAFHSAVEAQRQQTESWMARSASFQRFTGRTAYGGRDDGSPVRY